MDLTLNFLLRWMLFGLVLSCVDAVKGIKLASSVCRVIYDPQAFSCEAKGFDDQILLKHVHGFVLRRFNCFGLRDAAICHTGESELINYGLVTKSAGRRGNLSPNDKSIRDQSGELFIQGTVSADLITSLSLDFSVFVSGVFSLLMPRVDRRLEILIMYVAFSPRKYFPLALQK